MTSSDAHNKLFLASLAFFLAGLCAGRHLYSWPAKLRYPGEESHVEGNRLAEMLHLRRGVPIYAPPTADRFDAAIYGPLYYFLGARFVNLEKPAYLPLRVVSLIGTLGCAAGCALLAYWLGESYLAAALAPLVFLGFEIVSTYGLTVRCDLFALLLAFGGVLVAYRFQTTRAVLLAAPPMLLSFFYKPQFVAGPATVLLFLLLKRRSRLAFGFAGLLVLGSLILVGLFQFLVFPHQDFLRHFLLFNVLPPSKSDFFRGLLFFGVVIVIPLLAALEFLRAHGVLLLRCYLACAVVLGLATAVKTGSDTNYFLECLLILSSILPAQFAKSLAAPTRAAGYLVILAVSLFLGQEPTTHVPKAPDFASDRAIQAYLRSNFPPQTPALSYYAGDLVRAGLDTPVSDLYHLSWLIRKGSLSDRDLLAQLERRRFGVVVLNFDLEREEESGEVDFYLTEPIRRFIQANYRPAASLEMPRPERMLASDRFYSWVPRPR